MQVVFLEAPEELLAERRRLGLDGRDEMWEGELHVVPQPYFSHQEREARGVEGNGAVLAIEIRSPRDETDAKVPFYARFGLAELLIIDRDTAAVELLRLGDGDLLPVTPDADGWFTCSLDVAFRQGEGGFLEVRLPDGSAQHC